MSEPLCAVCEKCKIGTLLTKDFYCKGNHPDCYTYQSVKPLYEQLAKATAKLEQIRDIANGPMLCESYTNITKIREVLL